MTPLSTIVSFWKTISSSRAKCHSYFETLPFDRFVNKSSNYQMVMKEYVLNTLYHKCLPYSREIFKKNQNYPPLRCGDRLNFWWNFFHCFIQATNAAFYKSKDFDETNFFRLLSTCRLDIQKIFKVFSQREKWLKKSYFATLCTEKVQLL